MKKWRLKIKTISAPQQHLCPWWFMTKTCNRTWSAWLWASYVPFPTHLKCLQWQPPIKAGWSLKVHFNRLLRMEVVKVIYMPTCQCGVVSWVYLRRWCCIRLSVPSRSSPLRTLARRFGPLTHTYCLMQRKTRWKCPKKHMLECLSPTGKQQSGYPSKPQGVCAHVSTSSDMN